MYESYENYKMGKKLYTAIDFACVTYLESWSMQLQSRDIEFLKSH
jgi:hypothetical protein